MAKVASSSTYETTVAQDAFVVLGKLCRTCKAFSGQSSLIGRLMRGDNDIRIGTTEVLKICSAHQLKAGYLGGCHLCALIWHWAEGRLFDPSSPVITDAELVIRLTASNISKEYEMVQGANAILKKWWKLIPPMMYELVHLILVSKQKC